VCIFCLLYAPDDVHRGSRAALPPLRPLEKCHKEAATATMMLMEDSKTTTPDNVRVKDVKYPRTLQRELDPVSPCEPKINCDFSALTPNAFDAQVLSDTCGGMFVFGTGDVNVFDSSNILSVDDDPDLGSPNRKCNPKGPGRGRGGNPGAAFPNCKPLNNLLILQNPTITDRPNDDPNGGCFAFDFTELFDLSNVLVSIDDIGLLDIEEGATITVRILIQKKKCNVCFFMFFGLLF
jgi:hypothetical protein